MRRAVWAALGTGMSITMLLTVSPGYTQPFCTMKTLNGRYLFSFGEVTLVPPAFGITAPTPGAAAGFHILYGDGTGTDIVTFRLGGVTVLTNEEHVLSYTVNANCTGSITVAGGPSFGIFVAPNGESYALISTAPPGNGGSATAQRVSNK